MNQRCAVDGSIKRMVMGEMRFPLGVYPIEAMTPAIGYSVDFEAADGADDIEGEWEEWPDRYVYEIVVPANRLDALTKQLFSLLPSRVFPILDVIGHDAYRDIDTYISYDMLGTDRFLEAMQWYRPWFLEDGLCGFGAMCDDPFFYLFIDEHKVVTVRCPAGMTDQIERLLKAFDLSEIAEPAGADAAAHEHRGVLMTPRDRPDLLSADEIIENLQSSWRLTLNIDPYSNVDDEGNELGITAWRCVIRFETEKPGGTEDLARYAEVLLHADSYASAEETAVDAAVASLLRSGDGDHRAVLVSADRILPKHLRDLLGTGKPVPRPRRNAIHEVRWLN